MAGALSAWSARRTANENGRRILPHILRPYFSGKIQCLPMMLDFQPRLSGMIAGLGLKFESRIAVPERNIPDVATATR